MDNDVNILEIMRRQLQLESQILELVENQGKLIEFTFLCLSYIRTEQSRVDILYSRFDILSDRINVLNNRIDTLRS